MKKHALLSASSSKKWLNCTASPRLEQRIPDTTSKYALEGTLAHSLGEAYLLNSEDEIKKIENDDLFYPGMKEEVLEYVTYCEERLNELIKKDKNSIMLVEERINLNEYVPEGFGTGDCILIGDKTLEIIDLKFGKGIEVEVENNSQLMLYALGAYSEYGFIYDIENIRITVAQVRLNGISSWNIKASDLAAWGDNVVKPTAKEAFEGGGEPVPGEWCRSGFCKYRTNCKSYADYMLGFYDKYKDENTLSKDAISDILKISADLKNWVKEIEENALSEALQGEKFPGFKVVEGISRRTIKDEKGFADLLVAKNFDEDRIYKPRSIETLGNLEKLVGKKELAEIGKDFIIKPPGKPTLVPESDKRKELGSAEGDFEFVWR